MLQEYWNFIDDGPLCTKQASLHSIFCTVIRCSRVFCTQWTTFTKVSNPPQPAQADGGQGHWSMYKESWVFTGAVHYRTVPLWFYSDMCIWILQASLYLAWWCFFLQRNAHCLTDVAEDVKCWSPYLNTTIVNWPFMVKFVFLRIKRTFTVGAVSDGAIAYSRINSTYKLPIHT